MSGSPPRVTLTPDQTSYSDGGPIRVVVSVSDPDSVTEVTHGTDNLGRAVVESTSRTDQATISQVAWTGSDDPLVVADLVVTGTARSDAGDLQVTVRDGQGNETTATLTVDVTSSMLIGVTPDLLTDMTAFTTHMGMYQGSTASRAYAGVGAGVPGSKDAHVAKLLTAGEKVYKSAKDLNLAAYVADWDTITAPTGYVPWHECNRPAKLNPVPFADWAAFVPKLLDARDKHKNKALIEIGPCFSWYPAAIGHNEGTPWDQWADVGKGRWDWLMWDGYNPSPNSAMAPVDFVSLMVSSARQYGVRLVIGEWGIQPITGDVGDVKAAAWITGVLAEWRKSGVCDAAMYWCSHAGTNPNYHLDARPTALAALKKALAAQ